MKEVSELDRELSEEFSKEDFNEIRFFLSSYYAKNPESLSDLYKTLNYEMTGGILKDFLDKLEIFHFSEIIENVDKLNSKFKTEMPQYFLTEIEDKIILVDTQGWHYIRSALILYNYPINIKKTYKRK